MSTTDIVARLQLRAEQFSSDGGKAFAGLAARASSAASQVRSEFTGAFAEVQKIAQTALVLPRNNSGSLDLSQEIAQLNISANAAEQKAQALRELSIAQTAASNASGVNTQAMRLEADAAAVAALGEERHAQSIRERIAALEAVQVELNQTTSATRKLTDAEEQSVRRGGASFTNLGQQFIDFTVQVQSGQSAVTAFVQQLPQATYALSTMGGAAGKVGAALTGPVGTGLTIAAIAAVPFIAKMFDTANAAKAAELATTNLGSVENDLASIFGKTSSKIAEQNELLLINARIKGANLRIEAAQNRKDAATAFQRAGQSMNVPGTEIFAALGLTGGNSDVQALANRAAAAATLRQKIGESDLAFTKRQGALFDKVVKDAQITQFKGSGTTQSEFLENVSKAVSARANDTIADLIDKSLDSGKIVDGLKKYEKPKKPKKPKDFSRSDDAAEQMIAGINAEWDDQPRLIDRARVETLKLDNLIAQLQKRKLTPEVEKLIAAAGDAKQAIQDGLNRPFEEFVRQQRESLAVGALTLQGRDVDAEALSNALRIQQQQGYVSDAQLATIRQMAEQHERITRELEDQRRVVGVYEQAFSGVVDQADRFLAKLQGQSGGIIGVVQKLQRDLFLNDIFGGVERDIEQYIRKMTGRQTPAELLESQVKDVGATFRNQVDDIGSASADFVSYLRSMNEAMAEEKLGRAGVGTGTLGSAASLAASAIGGIAGFASNAGGRVRPDNDNEEIVVVGQVKKELLNSAGVFGVAIDRLASNLHKIGIEVPDAITNALKKDLPTVLGGITGGQLGGSVFASITGGKDNKLASSVGGVLGNIAGKELGPTITKAIGGTLGKTLGGAAGPIGSILGGVLGNVIGGLFQQSSYGTAILSNANSKVTASGRGADNIGAATGLAGSVQQGLRQIADQLGATLGNFDTVVGTFDGKYRVRTTASGWDGKGPLDFKGNSANNLVDFGSDQAAALAFAIADAVKDGAIKGLSAASQRILTGSSDLDAAISKVTLIEAIPKSLKAMLDPVGAAVDDLNRQWAKTKAALDEGGASTEQVAQAQQLYNLQLQQTLNSTATASQTLKDFRDSLNFGNSSPYSLRDQETAALAKLQPFLEQINAGKAVDQEKYASAANAAIDIERQIYGSTQGFFTFFDSIQAATNKAISSIDNAVPVSPGVANPFAQATATSAATTATNTATANDLLQQLSEQAQRTNELLAQLGGGSNAGGNFFTDRRLFATGGV